MNDNDDAAYYLRRAEQEDEAASRAASHIAASIHRSLAIRYQARAIECAERSKPSESDERSQFRLARD